MRSLMTAATIAVTMLVGAPVAQAQVEAFDRVECEPDNGVRFCEGSVATRVPSFDGLPLDVNVTLPAEPDQPADDGDYPLIVQLHGYGGSKIDENSDSLGPSARSLAEDGYAVLSYSARGFGESCGSRQSQLADPVGCRRGWIRLADSRFEVRDTQHLAGLLADQGLAAPTQIGAIGVSYGGGQSVQLATLRDRVRRPNGEYKQWLSPDGQEMEIAATVPIIPWTDLAYSLAPNGRTIDYLLTDEDDNLDPVGVLKQSFVAGLYVLGNASGYYAPPLVDPDADLTSWFIRVNAGEPYDEPYARSIVEELASNHSAFYLDMDDTVPSPTLISNGFTDDLFPVDEALRWENKVRDLHGDDATVAQLHFDYGHQRGQNKEADMVHLRERAREWFDRHVMGDESTDTLEGVEVLTQTCPADAPSGGPHSAPTWRELHPGEVRLEDEASQTIVSEAGDRTISAAIDPILAGNNPCVETDSDDQQGTATYRLPEAEEGGYTLAGSPTVIADLAITGAGAENTQIAGRLWDVAPDGQQTLVARGLYRPNGNGRRVFQLHPNAYRFEPGHVAKLELLGRDAPYARQSNAPFTIAVSNLDLRLPTLEEPDAGQVAEPADLFVPEGAELAPGYENAGVEPGPPDESGPGEPGPEEPGSESKRCKGERATIVASPEDDVVRGTGGDDVIVGTAGDDVIRARGGDDVICARAGDDEVHGGKGADRIFAGGGEDDVDAAAGRDFVNGQGGADEIDGGSGADRLRGRNGDDLVRGQSGNDRVDGDRGDDELRGNRGDDRIRGGPGDDLIRGGPGDDRVKGGSGNDDVRD